jgi:hypothetical protein
MLSKRALYPIGFTLFGGVVGTLLVGLFIPGDVGFVLRQAALLGFPTTGVIFGITALMRR